MRMILLTLAAFFAALAVLYFSLHSPAPAPAALTRAHAALFAAHQPHPAHQAGK